MNGPDPELAEARREEAERWLAIVGDDIDMARAAMHLSPPRPGPAAFHLQQAAEKLVKSLLVLVGERVPKTHDLGALVERAIPYVPDLADALNPLRPLSVWGVAYRYPTVEEEPEPSVDTLETNRPRARRIADARPGAHLESITRSSSCSAWKRV